MKYVTVKPISSKIERRSRYVTLPWRQYFWISTNRGPAKMAEKRKTVKECKTFLRMTAPRNKTVAQDGPLDLPREVGRIRKGPCSSMFDNANGLLCQERFFRFRNFATMVTWRHTSPPHTVFQRERHMSSQIPLTNEQWKQLGYFQRLWRYTFTLIWFFTEVDQLIKIL